MNASKKNFMPIYYEILKGYEKFCSLESEWSSMLNKLPFYPPSATHFWLRHWIEANKKAITEILVIVFREKSKKIIGIIPLYCYESKIFFFRMKVLSLMGSREQIMADLIILPEHQLAVINLLLEIVYKELKGWDIFSFRHLDYSKGDTISLGRVLHKKKIIHSSESRLKIPYFFLEGNWENYYAGRKKRFKKEIRRKTKKLTERGNIRYEIIESPMQTEQLQTFYNLEHNGWKGKNGSSILNRTHLFKLYQGLASAENKLVTLCNFNLFLDNKVISSSICLKTVFGLYVFKITYDEEMAKSSPGLLLRLYEIKYAYEQKLKIYDFSGPKQKWMSFFTDRSHSSIDIIIYRRHFVSLIRFLGFTKIKMLFQRWPKVKKILKFYSNE